MAKAKRKDTPWVVWFGGSDVGCLRCGCKATMPFGCSLTLVAAFLKRYAREHRDCTEEPKTPAGGGS